MTNRTAIFLPGWGTHNTTTLIHKFFLNNLDIFNKVYCLFEPGLGINDPIPALTYQLYAYIRDNIQGDITLIGHSMGGLMALDLIQDYEDIKSRTNAVITIASPLKGANNLVKIPSIFSRSATDMIKDSQFITKIQQNIHKTQKTPVLHVSASKDLLVPLNNTFFNTQNAYHQVIPKSNHLSILWKKRTHQEINGWTQYKIFQGRDNIIKEISPKLIFTNIPQI